MGYAASREGRHLWQYLRIESRDLMDPQSMGMQKEKMNRWFVPNSSHKDYWFSIFIVEGSPQSRRRRRGHGERFR
jgi:hypothetical protein